MSQRSNTAPGRVQLAVQPLESRLTPSTGSLTAASASYALGSPAGGGTAAVYAAGGTVEFQVTPFGDTFTGGVRTAYADVNGDGVPDLIAAAGPTPLAALPEPRSEVGSAVVVYDGSSHAQIASFTAYESSFTGGTYVAAADLNGDGKAEIVTGADQGGGPRVRVFDGASVAGTAAPAAIDDFMAINDPNFRGGVRLALGDITSDGVADLVVGAGFGGGPRVAAYDGASLAAGQQAALFPDFFAYEPTLRNGVFPAVGDLNGDGHGDLVFGAGPGGGPRVRAFDGAGILGGKQSEIANFFAGDSANRAGVQVGVTATGTGTGIVSSDLATGGTNVFSCAGQPIGGLTPGGPAGTATPGQGGPGGEFGGQSFAGSPYSSADLPTLTAAVVANYSGSGAGSLTNLTGTGADLSTAAPNATVTLNVVTVTPIYPPGVTAATAATPPNGLTITGTATVTTDRTGANAAATGTGIELTGSLESGTLTVSRLVASNRTTGATPYLFQAPASRDADRITLSKTAGA